MEFTSGIKATELIKQLQKLIEQHGDCEVYAGGGDCPDGVHGASYNERGDGYVGANSFYIR